MAEVTGILGDQPIELNNAATEATLRQLLAATMAMAKMSGKDKKFEQKLEKELNDLAKKAKDAATAQDKLTAAEKERIKAVKELAKLEEAAAKLQEEHNKQAKKGQEAQEDIFNGFKKLGKQVDELVLGATKLVSGLASTGDSLSRAASQFDSIPIVGKMLSSTLGAVVEASEKSYDAYKKAASVGANFGGSMNELINTASGVGLTFDQFSTVLSQNSQNLIYFSGTVADGARKFADVGKSMKSSGLQQQLLALGYSTEEINNGMGSYIGILGRTGKLQSMSTDQIAAGSKNYLSELDMLAQVTGKSRSEQQKAQEALMADAKFQLKLRGMDEASAQALRTSILALPDDLQKGAKDIISQGGVFSAEAVKLNTVMPGLTRGLTENSRIASAGGKIDAQRLNQQMNNSKQEAAASLTRNQAMLTYSDEYDSMTKGMLELSNKDADALKKAKQAGEDAKKGGGQAAALGQAKQDIAATSNEFTAALMNSTNGLKAFNDAFSAYTSFVRQVALPVMNFLTKTISTVVGAFTNTFGPVVGGLLLVLTPLVVTIGGIFMAFSRLSAAVTAQTVLANRLNAAMAQQALLGKASGVGKIAGAAETMASGPAAKAAGAATGLLSRLGSALGSVLPWVARVGSQLIKFAGPIGLAIGAAITIYEILDHFGLLTKVTDALEDAFTSVSDFFVDTFGPAFRVLSDLMSDIVLPVFRNIGAFLTDTFMSAIHAVGDGFVWVYENAMKPLGEFVSGILTPVFDVMAKVINAVISPYKKMYDSMMMFIRGFDSVGAVTTYLSNLFTEFALFMKEMTMGLRDKLSWLPGITKPSLAEKESLEKEKQAFMDAKKDADAKRAKVADQRLTAEEERQKQVEKDRVERDKATAAKREKRDEDAAKKKDKREEDSADAKEKREEQAANGTATTPGVDYSNPVKMLESFGKQQGSAVTGGGPPTSTGTPAAGGSTSYVAGQMSDMNKYLKSIALIESGGQAGAKAGTSTASGMFQFTEGTWKQMVGEMGKQYNATDRFDPKKSAEVAAYFSQKQKTQIEKGTGREASSTDLYMGHFLGAGGATKFLNAMQQNPNQSAAQMDPKAAAANKSIFYDNGKERTLQEVYALMNKKVTGAEKAVETGKWGGKDIPQTVAAISEGIGTKLAGAQVPTGPGGTTTTSSGTTVVASAAGTSAGQQPAAMARPNATSNDSFGGLVLNGINPTTFAFQDLVQKGINPLTSILVKATSAMPNSSQVSSVISKTEQASTTNDAEKTKAATEKAAAEAKAKKSASPAGATQETPESLLAQLNTKMDQLIMVSSRTADLNDRQLSVQRGLGGNAFSI